MKAAQPALVIDFWAPAAEPDRYWSQHDTSRYMAAGDCERDACLQAATRVATDALLGPGEDVEAPDLTDFVDMWEDCYRLGNVDYKSLAQAMVAQWTYLLRPDGIEASPQWTVELAAFSNDHPVLAGYAAE